MACAMPTSGMRDSGCQRSGRAVRFRLLRVRVELRLREEIPLLAAVVRPVVQVSNAVCLAVGEIPSGHGSAELKLFVPRACRAVHQRSAILITEYLDTNSVTFDVFRVGDGERHRVAEARPNCRRRTRRGWSGEAW